MQWQGSTPATSLVGTHRQGRQIIVFDVPDNQVRAMENYIGSIAISGDARTIAVTSPRGGQVQLYDARTGVLNEMVALADVCGVAAHARGFAVTSGRGVLRHLTPGGKFSDGASGLAWDNHLISL